MRVTKEQLFLGGIALVLLALCTIPFSGILYTRVPIELHVPPKVEPPSVHQFIEVMDGCGPYFEGGCAFARSAPTTTAPAALKLRTGIVLPVGESVKDETGRTWYQIGFTEWIRYPERMSGKWYVAEDAVRLFEDPGMQEIAPGTATSTTKRILVDRSEQMLYAYENDELAFSSPVSTGLDLTPTPRGTFTIYRKTPSRYMQGPLPDISDQYYDLPGVPWNLYFTKEGGAIHGAYWHGNFGRQWSHGCVNLPLAMAKNVYEWAPLGTPVTVRD